MGEERVTDPAVVPEAVTANSEASTFASVTTAPLVTSRAVKSCTFLPDRVTLPLLTFTFSKPDMVGCKVPVTVSRTSVSLPAPPSSTALAASLLTVMVSSPAPPLTEVSSPEAARFAVRAPVIAEASKLVTLAATSLTSNEPAPLATMLFAEETPLRST